MAGGGRALAAAIFGVETVGSDLNLDEELILSRAARTLFFIQTNDLPDLQGFFKFNSLKLSLKHLSFDPLTATKQKFFSLSFSLNRSNPALEYNCHIQMFNND